MPSFESTYPRQTGTSTQYLMVISCLENSHDLSIVLDMPSSDLAKIKRLIILGRYRFTRKAELERLRDGLLQTDVLEAIINANEIKKVLRSTSPFRAGRRDKLYIIEGFTFDGLLIYTKGVIRREFGQETLYILVSAKRST